MKFLICGLGSIGQRHYKNLLALGQRDIIVYRTGKGANARFVGAFEKEFKPRVFFDWKEALAQKPTAAFITNPTALHVSTALALARAGVNLFIEKPLSHPLENVGALLRVVKGKKLVAAVGYHLRFHPLLKTLKHWVDAGKLGRLLFAQASMGEYLPDWHPWEDYRKTYASRKDLGGGVILTQSHDLDYLYWLFGLPRRVAAFSGKPTGLGITAEALAEIIFEFNSGMTAALHMDYLQRPAERRFTVVGSKGKAVWDQPAKTLTFVPPKKDARPAVVREPKGLERNDVFLTELKHFLACLRTRTQPLADLEQGASVLRMALATKEALEQKRIVTLERALY